MVCNTTTTIRYNWSYVSKCSGPGEAPLAMKGAEGYQLLLFVNTTSCTILILFNHKIIQLSSVQELNAEWRQNCTTDSGPKSDNFDGKSQLRSTVRLDLWACSVFFKKNDNGASGNFGLIDKSAALLWIRENIADGGYAKQIQ
ncbi:hypothetical protein GQX74_005692 [Glossina fuscipes]|nr:hypothetical protein GQX74_005692 [Glossina fuscipes]